MSDTAPSVDAGAIDAMGERGMAAPGSDRDIPLVPLARKAPGKPNAPLEGWVRASDVAAPGVADSRVLAACRISEALVSALRRARICS